jgi:hypothetical protein
MRRSDFHRITSSGAGLPRLDGVAQVGGERDKLKIVNEFSSENLKAASDMLPFGLAEQHGLWNVYHWPGYGDVLVVVYERGNAIPFTADYSAMVIARCTEDDCYQGTDASKMHWMAAIYTSTGELTWATTTRDLSSIDGFPRWSAPRWSQLPGEFKSTWLALVGGTRPWFVVDMSDTVVGDIIGDIVGFGSSEARSTLARPGDVRSPFAGFGQGLDDMKRWLLALSGDALGVVLLVGAAVVVGGVIVYRAARS